MEDTTSSKGPKLDFYTQDAHWTGLPTEQLEALKKN